MRIEFINASDLSHWMLNEHHGIEVINATDLSPGKVKFMKIINGVDIITKSVYDEAVRIGRFVERTSEEG